MRFPEFEGGWEVKKVGNIASVSSGGTPSRSNPNYWDGDIPWITTSLIDFNKIKTAKEFITDEGLGNSSAKLFPKGTILMAMYGQGKTRGKVSILSLDATTNQACAALKVNKKFYIDFVFNYLAKDYERIRNLANDGGQQNLSAGLIKSLKIKTPSLSEQIKIADFLTVIDERITTQSKIIEHQESLMKGLMQQIFSQQLRFKDESGNEYPDWKIKKLGDIGRTYNGLTGKTKKDFGEGKPYIQYMQIFNNSKIDITKFGMVSIREDEKQNEAQYGDIFFTTSSETPNEIGTSSVLIDLVKDTYLNSFCFGFRPNTLNELVPKFSQFFFRSECIRKKIIKLAQGSTRFNMSKVELLKLKFNIPSVEEQTKIAKLLSSLDAKLEKEKQVLKQYEQQKKHLLQNLFI